MRIDEKYKRLIKCFFSVVMILLLTVTYHQFWVRYYNKIILYPFYRRGMWMMACGKKVIKVQIVPLWN